MDRTFKNKEEVVLQSYPFLEGDGRWSGAVEIVRRTMYYEDGTSKVYIDRRLKIGDRYLALPRRGTKEIIDAIIKSEAPANQAYDDLMKELNFDRGGERRRPRSPDRGGRRGDRDWSD